QQLNPLFEGPTTLADRDSDNVVRNSEFQIRETAVLTKALVHEVRFEQRKDFSQTTPRAATQAINVLDSFNGGGGQNNNQSNNRNSEFSNLLMYSGAKWTVKTGFQGLYRMNHSKQENNFLGTYTFSRLADYLAGRPLQFTQTLGNPQLPVLDV